MWEVLVKQYSGRTASLGMVPAVLGVGGHGPGVGMFQATPVLEKVVGNRVGATATAEDWQNAWVVASCQGELGGSEAAMAPKGGL